MSNFDFDDAPIDLAEPAVPRRRGPGRPPRRYFYGRRLPDVMAVSHPSRVGWRSRVVGIDGGTLHESNESFATIALALEHGRRVLEAVSP